MSIVFLLTVVALIFVFVLVPLTVGITLLIVFSTRKKQPLQTEPLPEEQTTHTKGHSLAQILKEQRIRCNMTQDFVAEQLDVTRQAVSKWENGTSEPSTGNLLSLARLYGVDAGELLKNVNPNG